MGRALTLRNCLTDFHRRKIELNTILSSENLPREKKGRWRQVKMRFRWTVERKRIDVKSYSHCVHMYTTNMMQMLWADPNPKFQLEKQRSRTLWDIWPECTKSFFKHVEILCGLQSSEAKIFWSWNDNAVSMHASCNSCKSFSMTHKAHTV